MPPYSGWPTNVSPVASHSDSRGRAASLREQDARGEQRQAAPAGHEQRLEGGAARFGPVVLEPDQQV